ncbi:MAG: sulfite exporter TauE/SafE family protein [Candidatus Baltobacteraceae bacterium]
MTFALELFAAALVASIFGSMVGLGGGFILIPILRLFFGLEPAEAAGTSLVLVVANSASGAFTYFLQQRVHVRVGLLLAAGGFPGSILGAVLAKHITETAFDWIFAVFLITVATDMVVNRKARVGGRVDHEDMHARKPMSFRFAVAAGFFVGVVSSLFGVGGGVIVVPTLLYFSELPAHAISATSHFAIFLTSPVGLAIHGMQDDIRIGDIFPLIAGGLLGGPIGARMSLRLQSPNLLIFVAVALLIAAGSLILRHILR